MGNIKTEIDNWAEKTLKELKEVGETLERSLSDNPEELISDAIKIESYYGRTGYLLSKANYFLDRYKFASLPSKENKTEFERKIELDNSVSTVRGYRDIIESYHDAIKIRINVSQSILAYMRQSLEGNKTITSTEKPY